MAYDIAPEIVRALLEWAAKRFDEQRMAAIKVADREAHHTAYDCAEMLRQLAKEIEP